MAFYNLGIRMLTYVKDSHERGNPFMSIEKAVWRLTKENADFFNIDAGTIEAGKRADNAVIDPDKLTEYHKTEFLSGMERLVNGDDEAVYLVLINGKIAWENHKFSEQFGKERFGEFLKGNHLSKKP
jgi:N-acyl-D-aspartate/D-glutamate deacylase